MARRRVQLDKINNSCSICLDQLKDSVTTSCGHTYCMNCINRHWDEEDHKQIYSCPLCRQTFMPRPVLVKNWQLEELRKTRLQAAPDDPRYAGAEDVPCDFCTRRNRKAHKFCLHCLASFCQKHLQPHYDLAHLKLHKLVEPSKNLQENICSLDEHRGHDIFFTTAQRVQMAVRQIQFQGWGETQPEPKTRVEFLKYSREITLDPNTANNYVIIYGGNRKAIVGFEQEPYPSHPDRFTDWYQVLSREGLTGRCYWEVERRTEVIVAVAYKDISRAGRPSECVFGGNDKFWALCCGNISYNFLSNNVETPVSGPWSSRVGVYLDHSAGILSFYSVSETMTLLHRVQTTFTQPLYAGLWFNNYEDAAELCELK